ncbi:MAG: aldehyde ferredoxin oxidoreductase family protein [Nitrososphaerota archaeon]
MRTILPLQCDKTRGDEMSIEDQLTRILYIDLSNKRYWVEYRRELFEKWLGGVGVALQLYREEAPRNIHPLSPENPVIFTVGPLTALYPLASKTIALFKSPLTGNLGESHAGGRSAVSIRLAGYGGIVIKGASDIPVYLVIGSGRVEFKDGSALWGITNTITVGRILREVTPGQGIRTIMRIGRAGEKLVAYSAVMTETYRHFGRLGLRAVLGSKKIKGIVIYGKQSIPVRDKKKYREVYDKIFREIVESDAMKRYHEIGTSMNILPLNYIGALPTRNLNSNRFEYAENICGETIAEKRLARRVACSHCPTACIHIAAIREPYVDEPYFYKTLFISYDHELLYSLGSMLGVKDIDGVLKLIDMVEIMGLDAISTGVCLAWATEAYKRNIVTIEDTLIELDWGNVENYLQAIKYIVEQPNEFYRKLAQGTSIVSKHYGGEEFALNFGGNEMPGYHTGYGAVIGYLIGSRHSHLDTAGYRLDQTLKDIPKPEEIVEALIEEESWRQVLTSLVICLFARGIYTPEIIVEALEPLGYSYTQEELKKLGRNIYTEKQKLKLELGFKPSELKVPRRIYETPTPHGILKEEYIEKAIKYYSRQITGAGG